MDAPDDDPIRAAIQNSGIIGSRMGSVNDVADAVEYFVGDLSRWVSGQQLFISGHWPAVMSLCQAHSLDGRSDLLIARRVRRARQPSS
ncbi:hypothetical protein ACFQ07_30245 [Actinomadura adrarensis]|uniref:Uncharacterized protein n=1 Tax=Actinomadura adrarensis TaxID=1819600 RepID=A0ABW3CRH0_9ACTN